MAASAPSRALRRFAPILLALLLATLLSGCAAALVGGGVAAAAVASDRRSLGNQIDDQTLERAMRRQLDQHEATLPGVRVKPVAHNGTLLLAGEVASSAQRDRIAALAGQLTGVRRVVNELAVEEPAGPWRRTRDTVLNGRAKTALLDIAAPGFDPGKVNVTTVRGEVYLMGLVTRGEASQVVDAVRALRGVRRIVKVFEYLD